MKLAPLVVWFLPYSRYFPGKICHAVFDVAGDITGTKKIVYLLCCNNFINIIFLHQMQLSSGKDLLNNTENFATAVGDILTAIVNTNISNRRSIDIETKNISA